MMQTGLFIIIALFMGCIALGIALKPLAGKRMWLGIVMTIVMVSGYFLWGSWTSWQKFESDQVNQSEIKALLQTVQGRDAIIESLKQKIQTSPDNPQGWYLLGRLYASTNAWDQALQAFEKARQLNPKDVAITVNYAQALWHKNYKKFNPTIEGIFEKLYKDNPNQPDALAMLAMAAYERKNYKLALQYWEHLLNLLPPQSQDAAIIRQAISRSSSGV